MKKLFLLSALIFSSSLAFAQQRDYAQGNRLYINGQPLFISGMNIAWNSFSHDVGDQPVNISAMVGYFKQIKDAGGNAVRWWLHTDAQTCPKINDNGQVTGIGSKTISNIRQVLDSAQNYGIVVSLTLFSFDLLNEEGGNKTTAQVAKNEKFLTVPANLDTYITNGLRPILDAVGSHPAIMCWEVFNEPEGMVTRTSGGSGWASRTIDYSHVIRFTAKIAAEVHKRTTKMASTGIHEFNKQNYFPKYTIANLKAAANGDEEAYLDFYMAHHYPEYIGTTGSPFKNPASFWGLEKPVLIGEFPARDWPAGYTAQYSMTVKDAFEYAYDNGYCGAMSWSMTEGNTAKFGNYSTTKPALENLFNKHQSDILVIKGGVTPSSSSARSSSSIASSSSRASSSSVASSSSRASSSSGATSSSSTVTSSSSGASSSSSGTASSSSSATVTSSSSSSGAAPSSSSTPSSPSAPSSSSSSNFNVSPIRMLSSIPSAAFNVKAMSNSSLLVESNAKALIYLYDSKGNIAQSIHVSAGSSVVRTSVPTGVYVVKNTANRQTQVVVVK